MALINTSVPNLIQGVSQQPDATRFDGQCEEQENALSSVADGLKKRPNTRYIASLMQEAIDSDSFVHFIDRSADEKYVIIQTTAPSGENNLRAFNAKTGNQCTINGSDTHLLDSSAYLTSSSPELTTQALTIADTTFLNNNTKTPQLTNSISPQSQKEAIVVVRQGDYDTDYIVKLSSNPILTGDATPAGTAATFNTPTLTEITPATVPPRYKLTSSEFGPTATDSPINTGGAGYDANNSQINVTSTGSTIQLPSVTAVLGGTDNAQITQLNLATSGVFEGVTSSSNSFNLAVTLTQSESGNLANASYTGQVNYTMTISGQSLADYNAAGRPAVDITFTGSNFAAGGATLLNTGGILEYDYQGVGAQSDLRAQNYFPQVTFSALGIHNGTKTYNSVPAAGINYWPYLRTNNYPSSWVTQTQNVNVTQTTYAAPTVTLSAGTPASTGGAGTAESNFNSGTTRSEINTNYIAGQILGSFQGDTDDLALFSREQDQNILILRPTSPTTQDFYVSTSDGLANTGLQLLYKEVASISDLPIYCKDGFKIKVQGDPSLNEDDFYAEFQTNDNATFGSGVWNEAIGFGVSTTIDHDTMPHGLISVGVDEFVFGPFNGGTQTAPQYGDYIYPKWADRTVGDDDSNPINSFVGTTPISTMTLFKNRLSFITGNNVSFSEAGQFFNFSRTTVRSLLDSAPIDVSVSSPQVTDITACVPFQGSLLLFADNSQLKLAGGDILSPRTVSITPVTQFAYQSKAEPLVLGSYIYYPFNRGAFSGINEFNVDATTDTFDANEITEHVPAYIPSDINLMASSSSEDFLVVSNKGTDSMYVYTFFWNGNQKVLSSWFKFTFTGQIQGINFNNSTLYAVITNNGETNLVEMPMESGLRDEAGYVTHLDMRVASIVSNGEDVINLPYTPEDDSVEVYTTDGLALNCSNVGSVVTLNSPVSADTNVWVGIPYTMKYTFSEQLFKAKAGNGRSPSNAAQLMVRNGSLYFDKTAYFKVKVTPKFRDTYENVFTPDVVGSSTIGNLSLDSGFFRFPVFTKPQDTTITIENDSALPSTFQSAEFESFVHSRSNRYG
jgi:hypothetical protein